MKPREDATPPLFGNLLKQHRIARGLTQEALAERAGLGVRTIKGIEQGARHLPRADTIGRLMAALQLSPDQDAALRRAVLLDGGAEDHSTDHTTDSVSSPLTQSASASGGVGPAALLTHLTPLIGRDEFIHDALALLTERATRLLTLVGPPGVGKTRVGLAIAQRIAAASERFSPTVEPIERVACIALASIRQPGLVLPAIAYGIGMQEATGSPLPDALATALRGASALLFLDNFEHLLDATPDILALLTRCPDLKILITSRAALRVRGERVMPVPPLAVPAFLNTPGLDGAGANSSHVTVPGSPSPQPQPLPLADLLAIPSVALFVQRAQASVPDFTLAERNAPIIAAICQRLDGLPLALELAATRLRLLTPSDLLARLTNRLSLLAERAPDLPPRQQTMRAAITGSYALLSESEQWTFRQLGVCASGCSLRAAEAICGREGHSAQEVLDDLTTLVAHSLIQRGERTDGASCVTMLETVREYALEQLDAHGERNAAEQAHSAFYCALAESVAAHTQTGHARFDLRALDDDYPNLQAALAWAIERRDSAIGERLVASLWRYWYTRGLLTEGRRWADSLLALVGDTDQRWLREMTGSQKLGEMTGSQGLQELGEMQDRSRLAADATDAADASDAHMRSASLASALNGAGMLAFRQGDHATAMTWLRRSLALHRWRGDRRGAAAVLNNLGIVATDQGLNADARAFHEDSLAIKRELGSAHDIAVSLNNLGCVARAQGHYAQARAFFEENLAIQRALGDPYRIAHALGNLGTQAYVQEAYDEAHARYLECLALQQQIGDSQGVALTTLNLGEVARARGALDEALALGRDSLTQFRALGEPMRVVSALSLLAATSYALGDARSARAFLLEILDQLDSLAARHRAVQQWAIVLAKLAHDEGLHIFALQFLVAAESQRMAHGAMWTPTERRDYQVCLRQARNRLTVSNASRIQVQEAERAASAWSQQDLLRHARACLALFESDHKSDYNSHRNGHSASHRPQHEEARAKPARQMAPDGG